MFQTLINVILPVFILVGIGYASVRTGFLTNTHIEGVTQFAQTFAIPCLLFRAISNVDLAESFDPALLVSYFSAAFISFAVGTFGARSLFKRGWEDAIAIGFVCFFSNSVLLGLPITERAFGSENLTGNYAIIAFHAPFCYAVGITVMEFARARGKPGPAIVTSVLTAMFKNVLIVAIALGFVFNIADLSLPVAIDDAVTWIIRAALPCALFALGGILVQYKPEGDGRTIAFVCAVSLILHPALVWLFGNATGLRQDLFRSAVVTAAAAPGFNTYIFASLYGRAKRVAASSVLIGTGLCLFSAWAWLSMLG